MNGYFIILMRIIENKIIQLAILWEKFKLIFNFSHFFVFVCGIYLKIIRLFWFGVL